MALRSTSSVASATATSVAVPVPTGAAIGDIVTVAIYLQVADAITAPSGFTNKFNFPNNPDTQGRISIYWKRLTAADTGTYTFSWSTSSVCEAVASAHSGRVNFGDPFDGTPGTIAAGTASTTVTVTGPTTTFDDGDLIAYASCFTAVSWTPPASFTERYDPAPGNLSLATQDGVSAGAVGSKSFTLSSSQAGRKMWLGALAPSSSVRRREVTTGTTGSISSFAPTLPDHDVDSLLTLVVFGKYDTATIPTIDQGWTLVGSNTGGTGTAGVDTGPMFAAVYQKVAASASETAPTVTAGATAPNTWAWLCVSAQAATGKSWRDTIAASAPQVVFASDTSTASPLVGPLGAFTGVQPTAGDYVIAIGAIPTDSGTGVTAGSTSLSATGLSGGVQSIASGNYRETALNDDLAFGWADWQAFTGTETGALSPSFVFTSATDHSGILVGIAMRQESPIPSRSASWTGSGAFTASVVAVGVVTASWTGSGAFTASSVEVEQTTAPWNGSGSFSATAFEVYDRAASWTGSGAFSAEVESDRQVNASWDGSGAFTATAFPVGVVAADWTGSGSFSASVLPVEIVSAAWSGSGAWTADVEAVSEGVLADWQGVGSWSAATSFTENPHTDLGNRAGGRVRSGLGIPSFDPTLEPAPATLAYGVSYPFAQAFGSVSMVANQPHFTVATARGVQTRLQILYGNRDITYLFGVPTPRPEFQRATPFDFGPSTLRLPQFANPHEKAGQGRWSWLRVGKNVRYRVIKVSDGTVLKTLYRGVHTGYDPDAATLTLQIGGQATGRMGLRDQQAPLFSSKTDVKNLMRRVFQSIALPFNDDIDATGIQLGRFGDTGMLDYAQQVLARAWTKAGNQWTVMPDSDGTYQLFKRDTTTIAGTIYLDDARTSSSLHRDISEEPNAVFGRGTTPEGRRVHNGVYPGLIKIDPVPPYPFNDGRTITVGTLNSDTDTGDGISVLKARLQTLGYLSRDDADAADDEYTDDVYDAVYDMNDEAQILPLVGNMTEEGWATLFNVDAVGYSVWWSKVEPMASDRRLRRWKRTADGAIRGKNPTFDPHLLRRDKTIDFGAGFEVRQMKNFARQEFDAASDPNWVGTVTLGLGAIVRGDHTPGDPIDTADVMADWELDPGQNYKVVSSAGGELVVHCSGITYGDSPTTLTVDTRARDALPVWEVIRRNKESRGDLNRRANQQRRASTEVKDVITEFEEYGGRIEPVPVPGGKWKVFPVVAGKAGYIERIRIRTRGPVGDAETDVAAPTRFVLAVFGQEIDAAYLAAHVPNPLSSKSGWYDEDFRRSLEEDYRMAYIVGEPGALGGYHPHVQTDAGATITGVWDDQAGFSFRTGNQPILYVAYFGEDDSIVAGGRIFWNQEIVGS